MIVFLVVKGNFMCKKFPPIYQQFWVTNKSLCLLNFHYYFWFCCQSSLCYNWILCKYQNSVHVGIYVVLRCVLHVVLFSL